MKAHSVVRVIILSPRTLIDFALDLMWSDPEEIENWAVSPRGAGWLFGGNVTQEVRSLLFIASNWDSKYPSIRHLCLPSSTTSTSSRSSHVHTSSCRKASSSCSTTSWSLSGARRTTATGAGTWRRFSRLRRVGSGRLRCLVLRRRMRGIRRC